MNRIFTLTLLLTLATCLWAQKREFRGAWIQCVNGQFQGLSTQRMQQTLSYQLDELKKDGCNAIIFQVRPECDALYESSLEPWSRFLTGAQGVAPSPYWDPLQWMITECHKRGMELHAWINPYRAKTKVTHQLASNHVAITHPERVFSYDGQFILNPALKENRDYICEVVQDIVRRYDIDGMHMDDYFYPYPAQGQVIPDAADYQRNSYGIGNIHDWRRHNVNLFVEQVSKAIHSVKPWVKFGISPFGIYRNQKSDPQRGSKTNGLQNYDDLYADVLLWDEKGWMDYCVPQIYWQIGHPAADYATLIEWWNDNTHRSLLFVGEDVERTAKYNDISNPSMNQLDAKSRLHKSNPNVSGTVLWYAKAAVDNVGGIGHALRNHYWKVPTLQPIPQTMGGKTPGKPLKVKPIWTADGYVLFWTAPKGKAWDTEARKYIVYCFAPGEKIDTTDGSHIVAITTDTYFKLPYNNGKEKFTYLVAALNRIDAIGKVAKKKIKL